MHSHIATDSLTDFMGIGITKSTLFCQDPITVKSYHISQSQITDSKNTHDYLVLVFPFHVSFNYHLSHCDHFKLVIMKPQVQ